MLGATARQITAMLNREYLKTVVLAFLIGSAGAWYLMGKWLQQFAYRTELELTAFAWAGSIAVFVALVAVSVQTLKAALVNPAESLRNE